MKKKYCVVCAIHEVADLPPHRFFTWAENGEDAVFHECPVCGSEGITSTICRPYKEEAEE